MKFKDIIGGANGNLARNKGRTILTIIAIFIGAFTISLSLGLNAGINDFIDRQVGAMGGEDVEIVMPHEELTPGPKEYNPDDGTSQAALIRAQLTGGETKTFTIDDANEISKVEGVKKVTMPRSLAIAYGQVGDSKKYEISGTELIDGIRSDILAGREVNMEANENEVTIQLEYLSAFGIGDEQNPEDAINKTIAISIQNPIDKKITVLNATIVGVTNRSIMSTRSGVITSNTHLTDEAQKIQNAGVPADKLNRSSMFYVLVEKGKADEVKELINNLSDDKKYDVQTFADLVGQSKAIIDAATYVLIAFAAIALLAASFGIVNTLYMSVSERTREIGLMKAMGLSSAKIFAMFSFEAVIIGLWGSVVAILAAMGVGNLINVIATQTFLKELPGFTIMQYPLTNIIAVIILIVAIAFLAGALPAKRAAKKNPIDALRYE